jgi:hypothetical protein
VTDDRLRKQPWPVDGFLCAVHCPGRKDDDKRIDRSGLETVANAEPEEHR